MLPSTCVSFITSSDPPAPARSQLSGLSPMADLAVGERVILLLQLNVTGTGRNHGDTISAAESLGPEAMISLSCHSVASASALPGQGVATGH